MEQQIILAVILTTLAAQAQGQVLLQAFNWGASKSPQSPWYNVIKGLANDSVAAGVTDVWFPPPSQSASDEGYLPGQLYNLDASKYGNTQDLKSAISALSAVGLRAVADIVINHRTGSRQDAQGRYCLFEGGTNGSELDWGESAVTIHDQPYQCGTGNADTGEDFTKAPDVDHANTTIQKELTDWMNWLKSDIGFQGWRFDFMKGYTGNILGNVYVTGTSPAFAVGEYWDENTDNVVNWIHSASDKCAAFDFPLKFALQNAINNSNLSSLSNGGKAPGVLGVMPSKAVTFVDNHDTAAPQNISPFPTDKILWGYAYIFTHPGVPTIFYDHFVDSNSRQSILTLGAIRKRNGISPTSSLNILTAQSGLYMASIDDKVVVKIGPQEDLGQFQPDSSFQVSASGDEWAVWEKKSAK